MPAFPPELVVFNVRLDRALWEEVKARAAAEDRPIISIVRRALRRYLDDNNEERGA